MRHHDEGLDVLLSCVCQAERDADGTSNETARHVEWRFGNVCRRRYGVAKCDVSSNMYAYFDAFVGAMRRGDVPAARCERCDRPAELSGVSVLDGSFLCRRCRWKRVQRLEEAMQEDDECTTRCCTDDGQGGDA